MQNIAKPDVRDILSENVKTLIGGFSQAMLKAAALKTGVSARTIAYIVSRDESNPRLATLIQFAAGYRISVIDLLTKNLGRNATSAYHIGEPDPQPYTHADPAINSTVAYMEASSKTGRAIVQDKARDIAKEYPLNKGKAA